MLACGRVDLLVRASVFEQKCYTRRTRQEVPSRVLYLVKSVEGMTAGKHIENYSCLS